MSNIIRTFSVYFGGAYFASFTQQRGESLEIARDKAFEKYLICRDKHPQLEVTLEMRTNETILTHTPKVPA